MKFLFSHIWNLLVQLQTSEQQLRICEVQCELNNLQQLNFTVSPVLDQQLQLVLGAHQLAVRLMQHQLSSGFWLNTGEHVHADQVQQWHLVNHQVQVQFQRWCCLGFCFPWYHVGWLTGSELCTGKYPLVRYRMS